MTSSNNPLQKLLDAAAHADRRRPVVVTGAVGGFTPLLLAAIERAVARPLVIITAERERAQELCDGIRFFLPPPPGALSPAVLVQAPDTTPYHAIAPSRFLMMERVAALFRMGMGLDVRFAVIPAAALSPKTIPTSWMSRLADVVVAEQSIDREALILRLIACGYARAPEVEDPGTFAVRGGILDLWSPLYERPVRLDFWGDLVESIRFFDPESQRSDDALRELYISPAREIVLADETLRRARHVLREVGGDHGIPAPQLRAVLAELDERLWPVGADGWIPAFYDPPGTVLDYVPENALVLVEDPTKVRAALQDEALVADALFRETASQHRLVFPPGQVYADPELAPHVSLLTVAFDADLASASTHVDLAFESHDLLRTELIRSRGEDHAFKPAATAVRAWQKRHLVCIAVGSSEGQLERLRGLFGHYGLRTQRWDGALTLSRIEEVRAAPAEVNLFLGELQHGFVFEPLGVAVLGDEDVIPHQRSNEDRARKSRAKAIAAAALASFRELDVGDIVVHVDHGIGRYQGLVKLELSGVQNDFLKLEYKDANVLYLPVQRLDRVQKYQAGEDAHPALDRLGTGSSWEKTKAKAKQAALDLARELMAVYAARQARPGHRFAPGGDYFEEFCAAFPYEETPDQAQAIQDIMDDMDRGSPPMDRLVCGDVGYGKTEVAMRAAMRAVLDHKQTAVLVPTTILCEQHRLTFEDRFRGTPVAVAALSRFRTPAEERQILKDLAAGKLDVVIGTHRLLSKDVVFQDLGLMVVDEEHRFGVRHKERLKQLKETVPVLTLTATPIPRTLNMALSGLRDMSIIATAPTNRLSVRTIVSRTSDDVIREAITMELERNGQVYYVHNRVETLHKHAHNISRLVPKARVLVGHGQMDEEALEKVMLAFMAGEADVLCCTTIVESGLDIPRANTIILDRADTFGLAQLYQLRGRVGRSSQRAYCYLLIPEPKNLQGLAEKRVSVIQRFSELGSGFHVATMDMEIRGAGHLLSDRQSGHAKDVGLELFGELLADAVAELKGEELQRARDVSCEMKVAVAAFLPEAYVPDVHERLGFYKQIAQARTDAELEDAFAELVDRAGRPPPEASALFDVTKLKVLCQRLGATGFVFDKTRLALKLSPHAKLTGEWVLDLLKRKGMRWQPTPQGELIWVLRGDEWDRGLATAFEIMGALTAWAAERRLMV